MAYLIEITILISCIVNAAICIIMIKVTGQPELYGVIGIVNTVVGIIILLFVEIARFRSHD